MGKVKAQKALGELLDLSKTLDGNDSMSIQFKTDDGYLWVTLFSEVLPSGNKTLSFGKDFDRVVVETRKAIESHKKRYYEVQDMVMRKLVGRMAEYGLTQKDLAEKIGIAPQTLRFKLQGDYEFKVDEMFAIKRILDIPVEELELYFGGKK